MIPKTRCRFTFACLAAIVSLSAPMAAAQDTPPPAEPEAEAAPGAPFFKEDIGDWRVRCVSQPNQPVEEVCQLYQLLVDRNDNPVSEFTVLPNPDTESGGVIATVVTPLETLLPPGLRMSIDGSPEQVIPFTWCSNIGCYARFRLGPADVEALKAGSEATIGITPLAAPDQSVTLTSSLIGFTRALESVTPQ